MKNKLLIVVLILLTLSLTSCGEEKVKINNEKTTKIEIKEDMEIESIKTVIGGKAEEKINTFSGSSGIITIADKGEKNDENDVDIEVKWK